MLGNCTEKMVSISSTTNEWPQGLTMASTSNMLMEQQQQQQQQQQIPQESPKCPRCDSSNTKFCYYNNYSLSQPRHFCKACKRYWTRGGTLRSVPVGGACRKNKKIKRSISAVEQPVSSSSRPTPTSSCPNTTHIENSPFGLRQSPNLKSDNIGTLPYGNYFTSKISSHLSDDSGLGFDTQSQMNGLRLGFLNSYENYQNGSLVPPISSYSMSGSSINSPTIASLLGSTLNQQKFMNNIDGGNQGLRSFEELPIDRNFGLKVKPEEEQNCQNIVLQNHTEQTTTSDPILYWNATNVVAWHDPGNLGSSVP